MPGARPVIHLPERFGAWRVAEAPTLDWTPMYEGARATVNQAYRGPAGEVAVWFMNGATIASGPLVAVPSLSWTIAGTADFDGNGKSDILWRGPAGEVALWLMNGGAIASGPLVGAAPLNWVIQAMR